MIFFTPLRISGSSSAIRSVYIFPSPSMHAPCTGTFNLFRFCTGSESCLLSFLFYMVFVYFSCVFSWFFVDYTIFSQMVQLFRPLIYVFLPYALLFSGFFCAKKSQCSGQSFPKNLMDRRIPIHAKQMICFFLGFS